MDPPNMSPAAQGAFAACILLPLLATAVFVLRVVSRRKGRSQMKSDDYTMGVALTITIGTSATLAYALFVGAAMGPPSSIRGSSVVLTYEIDVIVEQLYGIAEALIKISILLFYRRIFFTGRFPLVANLSIALMSVWALLFLLLFIFPVWPISASWTPGATVHINYDWTKVLLWHAITNIALDLYVLCLPIPIIVPLHLTRARKAGVVGVLGLGSFCVVAACVRLSYVAGVQHEQIDTSGTGTDAVSESALWSVVEPCCSVIAGCLPTLGPLLKGTPAATWLADRMRSVFPSHHHHHHVDFMGPTFFGADDSRADRGPESGRWYWPRKPSRSRSVASNVTDRTRSTLTTNAPESYEIRSIV